jgi:hypothetical protein
MRKWIGLPSMNGFFGLLVAAQAASPFDGTYQLSSSKKVTETFYDKGGSMSVCPDRKPGPLTIANGRAKYTTETGNTLETRVQANSQFEMRYVACDGSNPLRAMGAVDRNGTVNVRQMGNLCSYDFMWQKQ